MTAYTCFFFFVSLWYVPLFSWFYILDKRFKRKEKKKAMRCNFRRVVLLVSVLFFLMVLLFFCCLSCLVGCTCMLRKDARGLGTMCVSFYPPLTLFLLPFSVCSVPLFCLFVYFVFNSGLVANREAASDTQKKKAFSLSGLMSHTSLLLFLLFFFVCLFFFFLYVATCGRPGRRSVFRFFFFLFAPFCCLPLCLLRFFSFFFPFKLTRLSFFFFFFR